MNRETLMDCLGGIDDKYVREAAPGNRPGQGQKRRWTRWALTGAAAVLALVVVVRAVEWARRNLCDCAPPDPALPATIDNAEGPGIQHGAPADEGIIGDAPGPDTAPASPGFGDANDPGESFDIGDAPGHIRWHGGVYCDHGRATYEMPEGLELLGEVDQVVPEGGIVPEDAGDLAANIDGYAYWFPGNENLIVFRYKDWDTSYAAVELGRREPFLLMFREVVEEDFAGLGWPVYFHRFDMVDAAGAILEGTVIGAEQDVYTLEVTNVLKGNVEEGAEIQVGLPEGDGRLTASGEDNYLLFFLEAGPDGVYYPVNPIQGVYAIEKKQILVPVDDPAWLGGTLLPPYTCYKSNLFLLREAIQKDMEAVRYP